MGEINPLRKFLVRTNPSVKSRPPPPLYVALGATVFSLQLQKIPGRCFVMPTPPGPFFVQFLPMFRGFGKTTLQRTTPHKIP